MKNHLLVFALFCSLFINYVSADNLNYCPAYAKVYSNQMSFQFLDSNMQPYDESSFKWFPFQANFHLDELFVLSSIISTEDLSSSTYNNVCSYVPDNKATYPNDHVSISPYAIVNNQSLQPYMSFGFQWRKTSSTPSTATFTCSSQQTTECPFVLETP